MHVGLNRNHGGLEANQFQAIEHAAYTGFWAFGLWEGGLHTSVACSYSAQKVASLSFERDF
jgi:hypothetical protein